MPPGSIGTRCTIYTTVDVRKFHPANPECKEPSSTGLKPSARPGLDAPRVYLYLRMRHIKHETQPECA